MKVENAVIMAAGLSSRFLGGTVPKALCTVSGEVLIERQIRQLKEAHIPDIYVVVGHKKEMFRYLQDDPKVHLIENKEYLSRNNHSSIMAASDILSASYICSSDNYFTENVFSDMEERPFYSALYSPGYTDEYCINSDNSNRITKVTVGGQSSWYMMGHVFWDECFSGEFLGILRREYAHEQTRKLLWEDIYMKHLEELTLYVKRYDRGIIWEFDTPEDIDNFQKYMDGCKI